MHTIRVITRLAKNARWTDRASASIFCEHIFSSHNNPHYAPRHIIYYYATREEKDDSDEGEVAHERSEGAKTRVFIAYIIFSHACTEMATFLPETKHTKNVSQNIRQRQFCTSCRLLQR